MPSNPFQGKLKKGRLLILESNNLSMQKQFFIFLLVFSPSITTSDLANPSKSSAPTTPRSSTPDIFNHKLECLDPFHKQQCLIIQSLEIIKLGLEKKHRPLTVLEANRLITPTDIQHLQENQVFLLKQITRTIHQLLNELILDDDKQVFLIEKELAQRHESQTKKQHVIHQATPINIREWIDSSR